MSRDMLGRERLVRVALVAVALALSGCFPKDETIFTGGCTSDFPCSNEPVMVTGGHRFIALAAGLHHTCGLKQSGEAWCWGLNTANQLGTENQGTRSRGVPVKVGGSVAFKALTAGDFHSCGLAQDGGAWCWGDNSSGVLGADNVPAGCEGLPCSATPLRAAAGHTFTNLDAGASHNCGRDTGGVVRCWGFNFMGELGTDTYATIFTAPVAVSGDFLDKVTSGRRFTCSLDQDGALRCWGLGHIGQLATLDLPTCASATTAFPCSPTPVPGNTQLRFKAVTAGVSYACGLSTTDRVLCWGEGIDGQLGSGAFSASAVPINLAGEGTWASVSAAYFHACALKSSGEAYCWGANNRAQLGSGSNVFTSASPVAVKGGVSFTQIVGGAHHTCALTSDGVPWCWGSDEVNQLGRG